MRYLGGLARLILAVVWVWVPVAAYAQTIQTTQLTAPSGQNNRLLIVAPASSLAQAHFLSKEIFADYAFDIRIIDSAKYAPLIDEIAHDAFVYFGSDSGVPPTQGFLDDIARTKKPVLWIKQHIWLLGEDLLQRRGLNVLRPQNTQAEAANSIRVKVKDPARILNWLFDENGRAVQPTTVVAGNLTYLSFNPQSDSAGTAAAPLLSTALHAAFGDPANILPMPVSSFEDRVRKARDDDFAGGVHLPIYISETSEKFVGYDSDRLHKNLLRIKNSGAEWVTIQRVYYQEGINASQIAKDPARTATLASLENIVADAHKIGLMVRLIPVVNLTEASRKPDQWRGMIQPSNPDQWWMQYRAILLEAAAFARENEVESLAIGAELVALLDEDDRWLSLVADVRHEANYRGLLSYQINFNALEQIGWAHALDYLSIAAYWPLAEDRDADLETLMETWRGIGAELADWRSRNPGTKLEFGEIGYVSQPYTSVFPFSWKPHKDQKRHLSEQFTAYLALEKFLAEHTQIAGVSFFASTREDTDPESIGYTPFGKPASEVMERILKSR
ncbi:MAG: hypothetical protein HKN28_16205 [Alphaproteobacteria bacterium]|nr:hypothetical protein [Alphaproteobacteria bacterium]